MVIDRSGGDLFGESVRTDVGRTEPLDTVPDIGGLGADEDGAQVGDLDLAGVTSGLVAVRTEAGNLAADRRRITEQVAAVAVLRRDAQRHLLARTADDDRDAFLDRPWVERGLGHGEHATLEPTPARAQQDRQGAHRVLEEGEPLRYRPERDARGRGARPPSSRPRVRR